MILFIFMDKFIYYIKKICIFLLFLSFFSCQISSCKIFKIVLTGGPCAGKTKSLNFIKEKFENEGKKVFVINEMATELMSEGFDFNSNSILDIQKSIFERQYRKEENLIAKARSNNDDSDVFIICDRGLLDGQAYMEETEYVKMIQEYGFSKDDLLKRYDLIIYLQSVSVNMPQLFENKSNIFRKSNINQAKIFDEKVKNIWKHHPNFFEILAFEKFEDKLEKLILNLKKFI